MRIGKKALEAVIRAAVRGTVANIRADENFPTVHEIERVVGEIAKEFGYVAEIGLFPDGICEVDLTDRSGSAVRYDIFIGGSV